MTNIYLKNGKILLASDGRGLSQDCDCCDDPPPSLDCDICCPGDQEVGDSVFVSLELTLPPISVQAITPSGSDNGVRVWPSTIVAGDGVLFVTGVDEVPAIPGRVVQDCLVAERTTNYQYSEYTQELVQVRIGLAPPLYEDGTWSELVPLRCEAFSSVRLTVAINSLNVGGGSNAVLDLVQGGIFSALTYFLVAPSQAFQGSGPCAGSPITLPLIFSGVSGSYPVVSKPDDGTEVGFITINDVE